MLLRFSLGTRVDPIIHEYCHFIYVTLTEFEEWTAETMRKNEKLQIRMTEVTHGAIAQSATNVGVHADEFDLGFANVSDTMSVGQSLCSAWILHLTALKYVIQNEDAEITAVIQNQLNTTNSVTISLNKFGIYIYGSPFILHLAFTDLQPHHRPTESPTTSPTTNPSIAPSTDPSHQPTVVPTYNPLPFTKTLVAVEPIGVPGQNPTLIPSSEPIQEPTIFPVTQSEGRDDESALMRMTELKVMYSAILLTALVFLLFAFLDARFCRINDYFSVSCILQALVGFLDFVSDDIFALHLTVLFLGSTDDRDHHKLLMLMICSYLFIALPMVLGFAQLLRENQQEWIQSVQLRNWMRKHSYFVYILSMLSGSAFNAVSLINCEAFHLNVFSMGLTKRSKMRFSSKRLWSVVIFEVELALLQSFFHHFAFQLCF